MKTTTYNSEGLTDEENAFAFRFFGVVLAIEQISQNQKRLRRVRLSVDNALAELSLAKEEAQESIYPLFDRIDEIEQRVGHKVFTQGGE